MKHNSIGKYKDSPYNYLFHNKLDYLFNNKQLTAWCFGHSHYYTDKVVKNMRLVSNPFGYEYPDGFNIDKIIVPNENHS